MARRLFIWRDDKFIEISDRPVEARTQIITDSLPPGGVWHPATGKYVDSKSKFRQFTKAAGCIEIGDQVQKDNRQWGVPNLKGDILETIERSKRGRS